MKITAKPILLFNYLLFAVLAVSVFICQDAQWNNFETIINFLFYSSIIIAVSNIVMLKSYSVRFWDFRLYFVLLNLVFIMGQVWLCYFGKEDYITWTLIFRADKQYLMLGGIFALCAHQAIVCGMFTGKNKVDKNFQKRKIKRFSNTALWNTGLITFVACLPLKIYYDVFYIITSSESAGYLSSADIKINGMIYTLGVVSVIGLFFMICSKRLSKRGIKILISCVLLYSVVTMIGTGDRRFAVISIISVIICYFHIYEVKLKKRTIFGVVLLVYFALVFINVIQATRNTSGKSDIGNLFNLFVSKLFSFDIIWDSLSEFGITLMAYVYTLQFFPAMFSFRMGSQILYNIATVFPIGGYLQEWRISSGIQTVVNSYVSQPVGGAISTDLYGNFGFWAILAAFLLGFILKKLMDARKVGLSAYECAAYFSYFCIILNITRAGFGEIIRLAFFCHFIPLIILMIISKREQSCSRL